MEKIGNSAFGGCYRLKSITIPKSVTLIAERAFYDCNQLRDVYYDGSLTEWEAIEIGAYNDALQNCQIHYVKEDDPAVASGVCGESLNWSLTSDGLLSIDGSGAMKNYSYTKEVPWYN